MPVGTVLTLMCGLAFAMVVFLLTLRLSTKKINREVQKVAERVDQLKNEVSVETKKHTAMAIQKVIQETIDQKINELTQEIRDVSNSVIESSATKTIGRVQETILEVMKKKLDEMTHEIKEFDTETSKHTVEELRKAIREVSDREFRKIEQEIRDIGNETAERTVVVVQKIREAIQNDVVQKLDDLVQEIKKHNNEMAKRIIETLQENIQEIANQVITVQGKIQGLITSGIKELMQEIKENGLKTREYIVEETQEILKQGVKEINREIRETIREEIKRAVEEANRFEVKIEMPEKFCVQEGDLTLEFKHSDDFFEYFLLSDYTEIPSKELIKTISSGFLSAISKQYEGTAHRRLTIPFLTDACSYPADTHRVFQDATYVLSKPLNFTEDLLKCLEFSEKNELKSAIVVSLFWLAGKIVFSNAELPEIDVDSLDPIMQPIMERLKELYKISSYDVSHFVELNLHRKELLTHYYYYFSEVESSSKPDRIKEILFELADFSLFQHLSLLFESVVLLKMIEVLKLKMTASLGDAHIIQGEFLPTMRNLMNDEKPTEVLELYETVKGNVLSVVRKVRKDLENMIANIFLQYDEFKNEVVHVIENTIKIAKQFSGLIQKPVNYVFAIKDGTVKVLAKIEDTV